MAHAAMIQAMRGWEWDGVYEREWVAHDADSNRLCHVTGD